MVRQILVALVALPMLFGTASASLNFIQNTRNAMLQNLGIRRNQTWPGKKDFLYKGKAEATAATDEKWLGFGEEKKEEKKEPVTAKLFLINLEKRKDRCRCVKEQLDSKEQPAPYPVKRILAETPDSFRETCSFHLPEGRGDRDVKHGTEAALMCTNYKIYKEAWDDFQAGNGHEFTMIAEDDILINQQTFWPRVTELLNGACQEWDFLTVDSFWNDRAWEPFGFKDANGTMQDCMRGGDNKKYPEDLRPSQGMGAHFVIVRTSMIGKVLESIHQASEKHDDHVLVADHLKWALQGRGDLRIKNWLPRILSQMGHQEGESKNEAPAACDRSVETSDLQGKPPQMKIPTPWMDNDNSDDDTQEFDWTHPGRSIWGEFAPFANNNPFKVPGWGLVQVNDTLKDLVKPVVDKVSEGLHMHQKMTTHPLTAEKYNSLKNKMREYPHELRSLSKKKQMYLRELVKENAALNNEKPEDVENLGSEESTAESAPKKGSMFANFNTCW